MDAASTKRKPTLWEKLFGHAVLIVFCLLFPGIVTAIAPLSVVRLTREAAGVRAHISTRVWFIVPYRVVQLDGVERVETRHRSGTTSRSRDGKTTRSEDTAELIFTGRTGEAKAEISPVNVAGAAEKARDFLSDPSRPELTIVAVANWKFGVIAGGLLSLLTLLYVVGMVGAFFQKLIRWVRGPASTVSDAA